MSNTVLVALPFYLSGRFSLSSIGTIMAAYPILLAFAGPISGRLSDRYGSRRFLLLGLCGIGSGLILFALYLEQLSIVSIVAVLSLIGLGMGLIASPNNSIIMQHAPTEHVGSIGGLIALTRNAGMVIGAALGLGGIGNGAGLGQALALDSFKTVFQINALICIGALILLGYGVYLEKRRRTSTLKDSNLRL